MELSERHASVQDVMKYLEPNENLREDLYEIADQVYELAGSMLLAVETDSPQLMIGLQRLLEAKDAFVRAALFE